MAGVIPPSAFVFFFAGRRMRRALPVAAGIPHTDPRDTKRILYRRWEGAQIYGAMREVPVQWRRQNEMGDGFRLRVRAYGDQGHQGHQGQVSGRLRSAPCQNGRRWFPAALTRRDVERQGRFTPWKEARSCDRKVADARTARVRASATFRSQLPGSVPSHPERLNTSERHATKATQLSLRSMFSFRLRGFPGGA